MFSVVLLSVVLWSVIILSLFLLYIILLNVFHFIFCFLHILLSFVQESVLLLSCSLQSVFC